MEPSFSTLKNWIFVKYSNYDFEAGIYQSSDFATLYLILPKPSIQTQNETRGTVLKTSKTWCPTLRNADIRGVIFLLSAASTSAPACTSSCTTS